jgi:RNA-directed DNA polymerase
MTQLAALKAATSIHGLAHLLGYKPSSLAYILYKIDDDVKYTKFEIHKRSGGTRLICAPIPELKVLQRKLADLLENCSIELNEAAGRRGESSHGFKKGKSIFTNAKNHRKKMWVFNADLENFFGTINFGRVRGYFIKDRNFQLNPAVATIIAQIACHNNSLPQGAPSSPVISNLIGHILDVHLAKLAEKYGCYYSRYADDLTFSTNKPSFPNQIALQDSTDLEAWTPGNELKRLISHSHFVINPLKTRMQYRNSRQDVTGLVVNKKLNVKIEYRRLVRAMVNRLLTLGHFEREKRSTDESGKSVLTKIPGTTDELHGMLGFIDSVNRYNRQLSIPRGGKVSDEKKKAAADEKKSRPANTGKDNLYKRFLIYKDFFANTRPVILCEGETDNVYLIHAIRSLAASYPLLAEKKNEKLEIIPRIYKYVDTNTGRILSLNSGGTGDLGNLIKSYLAESKRFVSPVNQQPFILLVDNDKGNAGGGRPAQVVRKFTGKDMIKSAPFHHVTKNLYVVPTPLIGGATESMIEDFFDNATRSIKFEGKTFNHDSKADNALYFGKKVFAHKVVRPNADKIDFSAFSSLLDNITLAIEDFYTKHPLQPI